MDKRQYLRHRRIDNSHLKHCSKCGRPMREGCIFSECNEVQHCACAATSSEPISSSTQTPI